MSQNYEPEFKKNTVYPKQAFLLNNNPEVPGLIYKLAPMDEKMCKLNNVRKLWEDIRNYMSLVTEIICIQSGQDRNFTAKKITKRNS